MSQLANENQPLPLAHYKVQLHRNGHLLANIELTKNRLTVGTHKNADIQLVGNAISKQHARLSYDQGFWHLEDLASMLGTFVNNERIIEYSNLSEQDTIRIEDYDLKLQKITSALPYKEHQTGIQKTASNIPTLTPKLANEVHMDLDTFNRYREQLHHDIVATFALRRQNIATMALQELSKLTAELAHSIIERWQTPFPDTICRQQLIQAVVDDIVGLGPSEPLLKDQSISEIMVNCANEIYIERHGQIKKSHLTFANDAAVLAVIDRIVTPLGRRIDQSSPMVDARLADGSRVNAIIPPLAIKGPCITIRKFPAKRLEIQDLIQFGSMNQAMADFFAIIAHYGKNILVSGGTGTGKTTLLNVLSNLIPHSERVITIEDAAELQLCQPDLVSLEAKPANLEGNGAISIRALVKNALRMRPNRIVVGECRGGEALDMLQAMNTGHDGSLTTLHANSPRDALARLEVMVMMAGMDIPTQAIREQTTSAIGFIVQQTRFPCGSRKVTHVTEVVGMESGIIQLQDIFLFRRTGTLNNKVIGEFRATGHIPEFYEELRSYGEILPTDLYMSSL